MSDLKKRAGKNRRKKKTEDRIKREDQEEIEEPQLKEGRRKKEE